MHAVYMRRPVHFAAYESVSSESVVVPVAMKRPASVSSMRRPSASSGSSHSTSSMKDVTNIKEYIYPGDDCPVCGMRLYTRKDKAVCAVLLGGETITDVKTYPKVCNRCRNTTRYNLVTVGKETLNCMSLDEMKQCGALFITSKTAFSFSYLEMTYIRLLRGKLAPGQESSILHIYHSEDTRMPTSRRLREFLLHALEAYAVAKRTPSVAVQFNMSYPASAVTKVGKVITLPCPDAVNAISFDGHFGIHRTLSKWDAPRDTKLKGYPRQKVLREDERSCSCRRKDAKRLVLPQRTAGWHFAVDPDSRRILGAVEHIQNECNKDKVRLLKTVMHMPGIHADLLIHDDICHFQPFVTKHHAEAFAGIKFWVIDAFHCPNHTCDKCVWSTAEKRRCKSVRTNVSESVNAWVRSLNFFLNSLRPLSHIFWMEEMGTFYNSNLQSVPVRINKRTNVLGRAKRVLKKPAARKVLKRPSILKRS